MARSCNFYIDKGSDFDGHVQITGLNNQPVDISDFHFSCQAQFVMNPRIKINIECCLIQPECGYLHLHIPYYHTEKMPAGDWKFDIEMCYANVPAEQNRRIKVLNGLLVVHDEVTTSW